MRRRWKVLIAAAIALAVLLAINTVVVDSETKRAEVTATGGTILELSSVDMQVVDHEATNPRANGAPIVLLHGYATSLHWWDAMVPLLNGNHRVITLDLVGHGGTAKPKSGYAIPEQARAVAEALNRLGVEGATVVGHSMGGYVAASLAVESSELVDRVAVLGTPAAEGESSLPLPARVSYAPVLGQAIWRTRPDFLLRSAYGDAFAPGVDWEALFADPDQAILDSDAMTFSSYEGAHVGADEFVEAESTASRITRAAVPFLAILGAEDQIVETSEAAVTYRTVPGAEIRVFEGVGHSPHLEAPGETAELVLRFAGVAAPEPEPASAGKGAGGKSGGKQSAAGKKSGKKDKAAGKGQKKSGKGKKGD